MKRKSGIFLVILLMCWSTSAMATTMDWSIEHTFPSDLIITFGVGDVATPEWSAVIQSHEWDRSDQYIFTAEAEDFVWDNTWWIQLADNWGGDSGTLLTFNITDDYGVVHYSPDVPIYIPDRSTQYAFITMPSDPNAAAPVPEPATMLLFSTGLAGLAGLRSRKKKA